MNTLPRSVTPYEFGPAVVNLDALNEQFAALPLSDPGPLEFKRVGFMPVVDSSPDAFVVRSAGFLTFRVGIKDKIVPTTLVNERLTAEVAKAERAGGKVTGRRRRELRAQVLDALLPQALCKLAVVRGLIDVRGQMYLDTTSAGAADACIGRLMDATGSFPVRRIAGGALGSAMNAWTCDTSLPETLALSDSCVIELPGGTTWTGKHVDMDAREIRAYMDNGGNVRRLGLVYEDRIAFVLDDGFVLRSIAPFGEPVDDGQDHEQDDVDDGISWWTQRAGSEISALVREIGAHVGA